MSKRLRPLRVKPWKLYWPSPKQNPPFYIGIFIEFVSLKFIPNLQVYGWTTKLLVAVGSLIPLFFLPKLMHLQLANSERLRLLLERWREPYITKEGFEKAPFPRKWSEYFILQLRLCKLERLSYGQHRNGQGPYEVAAYNVFSFMDGPRRFTFRPGQAPQSHFAKRVSTDEGDYCRKNQFSSREIQKFGESRGVELTNDPSIWVVNLEKSDEDITLYYDADVKYFSCYVLCNQLWFQERKFPREDEYPFFLLQKHLPDFKRGSYVIWEKNPTILGIEVLVQTRDRKIVLQQRSAETAIHRGGVVPSISAGYVPSDIKDTQPEVIGAFREARRELGLGRDQVVRYATLGLLHIVPSNELNFVVLMETSLSSVELLEQLRLLIRLQQKGRPEGGPYARSKERGLGEEAERGDTAAENFEYSRILLVDADEVSNFSGEWRRYFLRKSDRMERLIHALHYYPIAAAHPDKVPWRSVEPGLAQTARSVA